MLNLVFDYSDDTGPSLIEIYFGLEKVSMLHKTKNLRLSSMLDVLFTANSFQLSMGSFWFHRWLNLSFPMGKVQ